MKFKRLNDNVIRCVITKEEMYDYGIEINEIVDDRDKAEDFLRRVMQEARYELDYKTNGGALSVQIAVLPEGDVAMTIAESSPEQIENQMNMLKAYLEDFTKLLEQRAIEKKNIESRTPAELIKTSITTDKGLWVRVDNMDECIDLAGVIDDNLIMKSQLYSYRDWYFYRIEIKQDCSVGELFLNLSEYGEEVFLENEIVALIIEHGRCILANDAISTLRKL